MRPASDLCLFVCLDSCPVRKVYIRGFIFELGKEGCVGSVSKMGRSTVHIFADSLRILLK